MKCFIFANMKHRIILFFLLNKTLHVCENKTLHVCENEVFYFHKHKASYNISLLFK